MENPCQDSDDIVAMAMESFHVGLGIGVPIGIVLSTLTWVVRRFCFKRAQYSTRTRDAAQVEQELGAVPKKEPLRPPHRKIKEETSNSSSVSGTSNKPGERNHRLQHGTPKPLVRGRPQESGPPKGLAPDPMWTKNNLYKQRSETPARHGSNNINTQYPAQPQDDGDEMYVKFNESDVSNNMNTQYPPPQDDGDEMYVKFNENHVSNNMNTQYPPPQDDDDEMYVKFNESHPYPNQPNDEPNMYMRFSEDPQQHAPPDDEPMYSNVSLQNNEDIGEYDYVPLPYGGQVCASNQTVTPRGYLFMAGAPQECPPPRPPR